MIAASPVFAPDAHRLNVSIFDTTQSLAVGCRDVPLIGTSCRHAALHSELPAVSHPHEGALRRALSSLTWPALDDGCRPSFQGRAGCR